MSSITTPLEGNERGPTLCFKGIDNASYYRLLPDETRRYVNSTCTGNTLNLPTRADFATKASQKS
jgi:pullulanase/glycogen debranching enzyme